LKLTVSSQISESITPMIELLSKYFLFTYYVWSMKSHDVFVKRFLFSIVKINITPSQPY
jgi:hypothetical protein